MNFPGSVVHDLSPVRRPIGGVQSRQSAFERFQLLRSLATWHLEAKHGQNGGCKAEELTTYNQYSKTDVLTLSMMHVFGQANHFSSCFNYSYGMPVILSCSLRLYRADVFFAMPTKPVAKKPIPGKPQAVKPAQKNVVQKKPAPDKVENLAKEYLAELREVDVTFEKGTDVLEKYRAKYPELASYIREIVPRERRIEIGQRLEGEDINLHLFGIRVLEDEVSYEVKLSGDAEHKTVKPPE